MKFTPDQELRALSWRNPFAEMMLYGKVETRTWDTKYRGWVLICSSKKPYTESELITISGESLTQEMFNIRNTNGIGERNGKAIAIGYLYDTVPYWQYFQYSNDRQRKRTFVKFDGTLYCHIYTDVQPIQPFDWTGTQGWKIVSDEIKIQIVLL